MSDRVVSAVIPVPVAHKASPVAPAAEQVVTPPPLAEVPVVPTDVPVGYAMAKVDASGRVSDQAIMRVLGWRPGDPLTITAEQGAVILRRDPRGVFTLAPSAYLQIPAPLRSRHRIGRGDRVLLVAVPRRATLLIYTTGLLHQVLAEHHTTLLGGERP